MSIRRNATIADIFARIEKAERIGSGIKRIMSLVSKAELPQPTIESNLFFSMTFKRDPQYASAKLYQKPEVIPVDTERLTPRQVDILSVLSKSAGLNTGSIALRLEDASTQRTIQRELQVLKKIGLVDSEGAGRNTVWFLLVD